jgi:CDP-diacylglycerol--serine O-phosphatidyltransferase
MKNMKFIIPNTLTIINLLSGTLAIVFVFEGQPWISIFLLLVAALADVLDGLTAKLLNATSEFGKQLDSLSDLVSFGVAPSVFMYVMVKESLVLQQSELDIHSSIYCILTYSSFLIAVFAALRLARFNIDNTKSIEFKGLPVPANALIIVAVWIAFHSADDMKFPIQLFSPAFLVGLVLLLSFLMISNITMLSFKFQNLRFKDNIWRYTLIAGSIIIFSIGGFSALLYIMGYYLVLSISKYTAAIISGSKVNSLE